MVGPGSVTPVEATVVGVPPNTSGEAFELSRNVPLTLQLLP